MLKGLAITPPVIGRISIGKVVERQGRRLPEKDDEFTITSQVQGKDGWVNHPLDGILRKEEALPLKPGKNQQDTQKLRHIPVRFLFDDPDLNLRASYCYFDRKSGRPLCVGNGETCKRSTSSGIQSLPCPSPEACDMALDGGCKPYGRLNVRIGDEDELGSFIFRTTGFNSIRTLSARLQYFHAVSGGMLSTMPLALRLRGKSTTQSYRAPIYFVDLTVRKGQTLTDALGQAKSEREERLAVGFDQAALDTAAKKGFSAGAFEESMEEGAAVVEEFYPSQADAQGLQDTSNKAAGPLANTLSAKLAGKLEGNTAPNTALIAHRSTPSSKGPDFEVRQP